jgi:hypothetical protein
MRATAGELSREISRIFYTVLKRMGLISIDRHRWILSMTAMNHMLEKSVTGGARMDQIALVSYASPLSGPGDLLLKPSTVSFILPCFSLGS